MYSQRNRPSGCIKGTANTRTYKQQHSQNPQPLTPGGTSEVADNPPKLRSLSLLALLFKRNWCHPHKSKNLTIQRKNSFRR